MSRILGSNIKNSIFSRERKTMKFHVFSKKSCIAKRSVLTENIKKHIKNQKSQYLVQRDWFKKCKTRQKVNI